MASPDGNWALEWVLLNNPNAESSKVLEKATSLIWSAKIYDTREDELINMVWMIKPLNFKIFNYL